MPESHFNKFQGSSANLLFLVLFFATIYKTASFAEHLGATASKITTSNCSSFCLHLNKPKALILIGFITKITHNFVPDTWF